MNIHLIAIGGSAMHNLALTLHEEGQKISGSDDLIFEPSKSRLEARNLLPNPLGWFPEKISPALDAVILGMHARKDNPELQKARELGLKIYSYPEFLYERSKDKTRVVISGSHGKTSITAIALHVLKFHHKEIDFMVGARPAGYETMVRLDPTNDHIMLEGDEYPASAMDLRPKFHLYRPNIALINGIAWDHINAFPTWDEYVNVFREFINTITPGGALIYNEEDPTVKELVESAEHFVKKFPYKLPEYFTQDSKTFLETQDGPVPLKIFGKHNLLNLEGARIVCNLLGVMDEMFYEAVSSFEGADKRLTLLINEADLKVYRDFAHSPSKARAATEAVKEQHKASELVACLELHTYSSLNKDFLTQYRNALDQANIPIVFYNEETLLSKQADNISPEWIKTAFDAPHMKVFTSPHTLQDYLTSLDKRNKTFLFMSSGHYGGIPLEKSFE